MKLQLKHLAPYLSYDLEVVGQDDNGKTKKLTLIGIVSGIGSVIDEQESYHRELSEIKPLLIPLSELTKDDFIIGMGYRDGEFVFIQYLLKAIKQQLDDSSIKLSDYQYLVSNHFDVFNLIPHGLALNKMDFK